MDTNLIKKLETCIKWTDSDITCTVKITDLQRIIQEYKNQDFIIKEMAEDLRTPVNSPEWIIKYYKEKLKNGNNGKKIIMQDDNDLFALVVKKDKLINEMAEQLAGIAIWDNKKDEPIILASKEEVIEYYEERCK